YITEIELFRFVILWGVGQDKDNWKNIVKPFLQFIRFPLITVKDLVRQVRVTGLLSDEEYIEALEFNVDQEFFLTNHKITNIFKFQERTGKPNPGKFLPGPNYSLSNDCKTITKTSGEDGDWDVTAISSAVTSGTHRWS